ncbi:MAG: FGGY-family carbohydrate kinase, partial [Calditrichota bacterium]
AGIAGDQQSALFGQVCTTPGMVKNTYGTGCFMMMYTGEKAIASSNNLLTTVALQLGDTIHYALEGSVFIAGAAIQWLRDAVNLIDSAAEIEALAGSVEDNGGVYVVPAFAGLGAPYWDPYARGAILGLTRGSSKAHIARATLESLAHQTVDVLKAMEADSGIDITELRADGGATVNNLLMQIQADLLGTTVVRPEITETTALGAAYLAGLATGFWKDQDEIQQQWKANRRFVAEMADEKVATQRKHWKRAVERSRGWVEED